MTALIYFGVAAALWQPMAMGVIRYIFGRKADGADLALGTVLGAVGAVCWPVVIPVYLMARSIQGKMS